MLSSHQSRGDEQEPPPLSNADTQAAHFGWTLQITKLSLPVFPNNTSNALLSSYLGHVAAEAEFH